MKHTNEEIITKINFVDILVKDLNNIVDNWIKKYGKSTKLSEVIKKEYNKNEVTIY